MTQAKRSISPAARRSKSRRELSAKRKTALVVVALLAGGVLLPMAVLIGFLDGYGQQDRTQKADVIVVLGAQVRPDGSAGIGLRLRTLHALHLYRKGIAPKIICTGGVGDNPPAEAEVAAKLLMTKGVPRKDVVLENSSTSTWENAINAAKICKARHWKRVVVVSDPFHLWRAERNFRHQGVLAFGSPVAREQWQVRPLLRLFWTAREALLVARDWCLGRV